MSAAQQERGRITRAGIIEVARRLFSEFGYGQTGIADIQAATGLTKGAFYHHFRTKQELAVVVLQQAGEDYERELIAPVRELPIAIDRVIAILDGLVALNCKPEWRNCQLLGTMCGELSAHDAALAEAVQGLYGRLLQVLETWLSEAQQQGDVSPEVPAAVWAQTLVNLLVGTVMSRKAGFARVPADVVIGRFKQLLPAHAGRAAE